MANTALKSMFKTDLIELIRDVLTESNRYYLFVSRANPYENDPNTTAVESDVNPPSIQESSRHVYDTMRQSIFMKRLQRDNIKLIVPRIDWTYGTVYTPYSETTDMAGTDYYVFTTENNIYKCMGANGASTIMPTGKSIDTIRLSDGYSWKYIYTVPEDYLGHLTLDYIPVFLAGEEYPDQKEVQNAAKPASIDNVSFNASLSPTFSKIYKTERFFTKNNTIDDLGLTSNAAGSTLVTFNFAGEADDPANGYWNNYAIHVTAGPGVGQYMRIVDFKKGGNAGGSYYYAEVYPALDRKVVALSEVSDPSNASKMKIVPYVVIDGDGENGSIIPLTSFSKKIVNAVVANSGRNYTAAKPRVVSDSGSASIGSQITAFNNAFTVSLSTPLGHGYSAIREFNPASLMIVTELDGTESGKMSVRNDYRQFGLIKNPYLYGGLTLAGDEQEFSLMALVIKQPSKGATYDFTTFATDNYLMGKETRATAKIVGSEKLPGSRFYRLFLSDLVGEFRFSDDASSKSRVYFGATFTAPFATGDVARQYQNQVGVTLSAYGTILSYDLYDRNVLIDTTYGSFSASKSIFFGTTSGYTLESSRIVNVDEEFGEQLQQVSFGVTSGSEFLTFGGDELFGRMASTELLPTVTKDTGEYDLTTKMTIVAASQMTDGILASNTAVDGTISQVDTDTLKKVTGDIIDFKVPGGLGFTGTIYMTNVKGQFNSSDALKFTPYGSTAENALVVTINSITNPDIKIGSGQVLYIENVRPIQRNIEQSEEFKIVIGF
jgi:hypothetical protein